MITINLDESIVHRCRNYYISDLKFIEPFIDPDVKFFEDKILSYKNAELIIKVLKFDNVLPRDYFINCVQRAIGKPGFYITISSKYFDEVLEKDNIPLYSFCINKDSSGEIESVYEIRLD